MCFYSLVAEYGLFGQLGQLLCFDACLLVIFMHFPDSDVHVPLLLFGLF